MTRRVEAEVSFRFRGALARSGRATKAVDKTVTVSTDRGEPRRTIRVGDELWSAAIATPAPTDDRRLVVTVPAGSSLPKAIQAFLAAYVGQVPPNGQPICTCDGWRREGMASLHPDAHASDCPMQDWLRRAAPDQSA